MKYVAPDCVLDSFNCPHCGAFAHHPWYKLLAEADWENRGAPYKAEDLAGIEPSADRVQGYADVHAFRIGSAWITECSACKRIAFWDGWSMVHPRVSTAPLPNPDLPDDCLAVYKEAAAIVQMSPRGASALLRLAIQMLCKHLGEPGKDINTDIGSLVKKGLPEQIRKALDAIRVIGNESVHPGSIEMSDNVDVAIKLFHALNVVASAMITQPKEIDALYALVPPSKQAYADKRDGRSSTEG